MITADEIFEMLSEYYTLTPSRTRWLASAEEFYVDGVHPRVGIIASASRDVLRRVDRLHLTADGQLRNCLFAGEELDLPDGLRNDSLDGEKVDGDPSPAARRRRRQAPRPRHQRTRASSSLRASMSAG